MRDKRWIWITVAVLVVIAAVTAFGWMTLNTVQSKTGGWLAAGALLVVGVGGAVAFYVLAPKEGSSPLKPFWATPKGAATLLSAAFAGLGAMSLLFPLMDPPNATQADVEGATKTVVGALDDRLGPSQNGRKVIQSIPGLWGEDGCGVVYSFEVRDQALLIERVKKEAGMADYDLAAEIVASGSGDTLHAVIERSSDAGEQPGQTLVFTYTGTGAGERLNWQNRTHRDVGGTMLHRCPA